ncbi:MAG: DUF4129 domain-containing protein [Chloroflexota bacterium]
MSTPQSRPLPLAMYVITMSMEMCCLYLGLALVREHLYLSYIAFVLILALYPLSFFLKLNIAKRTRLLTAVFGIVILFTLVALAIWGRPASNHLSVLSFAALIGLQVGFFGLAWWLGSTLIGETGYRRICLRFLIGVPVLLVLALARGGTYLPAVLFFTLAAFALVLARWEGSIAGSRGILRHLSPWQVILGGAAVLVPAIAIFLSLSPDIARIIVNWLLATWRAIFSPTGPAPASARSEPVDLNLSCSWNPQEEPPIPMTTPPTQPPAGTGQTDTVFIWLIIFAVAIAGLFLIYLTVKRMRARRQARSTEMTDVETALISANLFHELAALFQGMGKRLWYLWLSLFRGVRLKPHRPAFRDEPLVSVRALYRSLLDWAASQGLPRAPSQTPSEYLRVLCQKFPQEDRGLKLITGAYLEARYSRSPSSDRGFEIAQRAWQQIRAARA